MSGPLLQWSAMVSFCRAPAMSSLFIYRPDKELARNWRTCALSQGWGRGRAAPEPPQQFQPYLSWGVPGQVGAGHLAFTCPEGSSPDKRPLQSCSQDIKPQPQKQLWDSHLHGTMTQDQTAHPYQ